MKFTEKTEEILQKYNKKREYSIVKNFDGSGFNVMIKSKSGNAMTAVATDFSTAAEALKKYPDAEIKDIQLRKESSFDGLTWS